MKWVTFISFVFLVSSAESRHLPRRSRDAGPVDAIGHCYSEVQDEDFQGIALVGFVHLVRDITYEDAEKMVEDITGLGKKCAADEHAVPECTKSFDVLILEELCHEQSVAERYGYSECCAKADHHERNECFLSHRNASTASFPPYQHPEAEAACKEFHDNRLDVLGHFLFEITRRNPDASTLLLFSTTSQYEAEVLVPCCQAEDKAACFKEKVALSPVRSLEEMPPLPPEARDKVCVQQHFQDRQHS